MARSTLSHANKAVTSNSAIEDIDSQELLIKDSSPSPRLFENKQEIFPATVSFDGDSSMPPVTDLSASA